MKAKVLVVVICILSTNLIWGFEFLGIKSGMSKSEVKSVILYNQLVEDEDGSFKFNTYKSDFDGSDKITFSSNAYSTDSNTDNKFANYEASFAYLIYYKDALIEIELYFFKPFDKIELIGEFNALKKIFPNVDILDYSESNRFGSIDYWIVKLTDSLRYNNAIKETEEHYLKKIKFN